MSSSSSFFFFSVFLCVYLSFYPAIYIHRYCHVCLVLLVCLSRCVSFSAFSHVSSSVRFYECMSRTSVHVWILSMFCTFTPAWCVCVCMCVCMRVCYLYTCTCVLVHICICMYEFSVSFSISRKRKHTHLLSACNHTVLYSAIYITCSLSCLSSVSMHSQEVFIHSSTYDSAFTGWQRYAQYA